MITKVTGEGVFIPKAFFGDAEDVEIRRANNFVVVAPVHRSEPDPIYLLGEEPVLLPDVSDASVNHDAYIYPA